MLIRLPGIDACFELSTGLFSRELPTDLADCPFKLFVGVLNVPLLAYYPIIGVFTPALLMSL